MAHMRTEEERTGIATAPETGEAAQRLDEQAAAVERLFPEIHRHLFALEPGFPMTEMPLPQLRMFVMLRDGPLPLYTLGERLGISPSTVTQVADRLEEAGLVVRRAGTEDRRVKRLQLTTHGEGILHSRQERRVRRIREALSRLPEERRREVLDALYALVVASASEEPQGRYQDPTGERAQG